MGVLRSNMDVILVGLPMVGLLFVGYFRLDELFSRPQDRRSARRRAAAEVVAMRVGHPLGIDPDGVPLEASSPKRGKR